MFGHKYLLRVLQRELSDSARSAGIAFTVDSEAFLVVASDDDVRRLSSITSAIDRRILHAYWCYSAESFEKFQAERDINIVRQVPFIEYDHERQAREQPQSELEEIDSPRRDEPVDEAMDDRRTEEDERTEDNQPACGEAHHDPPPGEQPGARRQGLGNVLHQATPTMR